MVARLRGRARATWNLPELKEAVKESQTKRRLVGEALKRGRPLSWDFVPQPDYSHTYVRSANSHEVIDRKDGRRQ